MGQRAHRDPVYPGLRSRRSVCRVGTAAGLDSRGPQLERRRRASCASFMLSSSDLVRSGGERFVDLLGVAHLDLQRSRQLWGGHADAFHRLGNPAGKRRCGSP